MGRPDRKKPSQTGIVAVLAGCLVVVFALLAPSPAASAGVDRLLSCNSLSDAIEREDGSIVAVGLTRPCPDSLEPASPGRWQVIVGLHANGALDRGFGDGGYALESLAERENVAGIVSMPGGGFLVYTDRRIRSYSASGVQSSEFGGAGRIVPLELGQMNAGPITDVVASAGGSFLVAGVHSGKTRVARYDGQGRMDTGFGTGGIVESGVGYPSLLAVDSTNRILVGGPSKMIRLRADGAVDSTFGDSGHVELPGWNIPYELATGDDDRIHWIAGYRQMYLNPAFHFILDSKGQPETETPDAFTSGINDAAMTPGGVAWASGPGRMMDPRFAVGYSGRAYYRPYVLGPGSAEALRAVSLRDGSLLAIGYAYDSDQGRRSQMAMARIDPSSGDPVTSFGADGTRLLPGNRCARGAGSSFGDWRRCRVKRPRVTGSVKLAGRFAKRPVLSVKASLGTPPSALWGTMQRLTVTLPRGMKLRKGAGEKIRVSTHPYTPVKVRLRKGKISLLAQPFYEKWGGIYWGDEPPPDSQITFRLKLRRGGLKPLTRRARKQALRFRLAGAFEPVKGGMKGDLSEVWFAGNRSATTVRVKAPGLASGKASASALNRAQRKAKRQALRNCRKIRRKARRKACTKRVNKRFRKLARKRAKPKPKPKDPVAVGVFDDYFAPSSVTIKSGESVKWVWDDGNLNAHNVNVMAPFPVGLTAAERYTLNSPGAPVTDYTFGPRTLTRPGTYHFVCSLHAATMTMRVTVTG